MSGVIMKPWEERNQIAARVQHPVATKLKSNIAGVRAMVYPLPSLPVGGSPLQIQFVLNTIEPFEFLYPYCTQLEQAAQKSGLFIIINSSLSYDKPQIHLEINRDKAAQMGINMANIGNALSIALGGNQYQSI